MNTKMAYKMMLMKTMWAIQRRRMSRSPSTTMLRGWYDDEGKARFNCHNGDDNNTADDGPSKRNNQLDDDNEQGCHALTGVAAVSAVALDIFLQDEGSHGRQFIRRNVRRRRRRERHGTEVTTTTTMTTTTMNNDRQAWRR
jgi:hypothetical protein